LILRWLAVAPAQALWQQGGAHQRVVLRQAENLALRAFFSPDNSTSPWLSRDV